MNEWARTKRLFTQKISAYSCIRGKRKLKAVSKNGSPIEEEKASISMHKNLPSWQLILDSLQQNIEVMLMYVLESTGSSPGRQGFCMVVNAREEMSGSLGGGIMEHKFVELAKSILKKEIPESSIHQQLHDKAAIKNQSGMICSGKQVIFLYTVHDKEKVEIHSLIHSLQENKNGTLHLTAKGIHFSDKIPAKDFYFIQEDENNFLYEEKTGYKNNLYIIGGGHCSLAFSELMSRMDFYIVLIEEREGLNTMEKNNFVHEKLIVNNYSGLTELISSGSNNYIVIMTVGYRTDELAVRTILGKSFKYLGILGSKNKIEKLLGTLLNEGISPDVLGSIHAPVGLSIKSQTTEEIAVSIAAEIINVKNKFL